MLNKTKTVPLKIFITFLFVSFFITIQAQIANWQWAKSIVGGLEPMAVSVDSNGNTFVTGYFQSPTITLGNITLTNVNNSPDQTWDFFIAKYDTAGNVIWAKSAGGSSFDQGRSLSADAAGNVFVTGWFGGTIVFGTTTLSSVGGNSTFLVKYDALGNVLWAKDVSGRPTTICIDNTGNAYLSGEFSTATCTFGSTVLTNTDPSGQSRDIFIAILGLFVGLY